MRFASGTIDAMSTTACPTKGEAIGARSRGHGSLAGISLASIGFFRLTGASSCPLERRFFRVLRFAFRVRFSLLSCRAPEGSGGSDARLEDVAARLPRLPRPRRRRVHGPSGWIRTDPWREQGPRVAPWTSGTSIASDGATGRSERPTASTEDASLNDARFPSHQGLVSDARFGGRPEGTSPVVRRRAAPTEWRTEGCFRSFDRRCWGQRLRCGRPFDRWGSSLRRRRPPRRRASTLRGSPREAACGRSKRRSR